MDPVPETAETEIRPLVEQLYESEGLTDALSDEAASMLLQWGEQQLNNLAQLQLTPTDLEAAAQSLRRAIRTINRIFEERTTLSDMEMVEQLLKLIEQVVMITVIAHQTHSQEVTHDQET